MLVGMTVFYIACFLATLSLLGGVLVMLRAGNKPENRVFFLITLLSATWSVIFASIELPESIDTVQFFNKMAYLSGLLLMLVATLFTYYFPTKQSLKSFKIYLLSVLPLIPLSLTESVAGTVQYSSNGFVFKYGEWAVLYVLAYLLGITLIIYKSVISRKKLSIQARAQLDFIMFGYSISLLIGIFLSVILPIVQPQTALDDLAPGSLTFMILFVSYAIVKHKLFDFRSVLVRALSYLLITGFILVAYSTGIFVLKRAIFPELSVSTGQFISNIAVSLILILTYPTVKKVFDRLTRKLFFRDRYDAQSFIDDLNQTLVTNVDLDSLLNKASAILENNLKASSCSFYIRDTSYFKSRMIGSYKNKINDTDMETLQNLTSKLHKKVHSTEYETQESNEFELNNVLKKYGIEIVARLVSTLEFEVKGIGYIFLAPKRNGSPYTNQDLKILEIIANELVIAVENVLRFEEIEQFNVTLQKKIDEATNELKRSNDKLKALDEAKDEFVSMASHQLRTPLTSIKGYISMVLEEDAGKINPTQKQMLGQAMFSSQRMVYLISDLLNVSRLKTGKFIIEAKPVYLPDLVESELSQLYDGANAKNITLSFDKPKKFTMMNLDDMKIRQVVMNFTDNAIYYTPNGGKITLALKDKKDSIEFTVKDTGIGVPKNEQHKLFAKFYRADNARKARPDGTGLGLFMAKKVIIAQGGSLLFSSKEGKGSTFGFSFPKDKLEII